jgi:hypothetical protein
MSDARLLMALLSAVCALGLLSSLFPTLGRLAWLAVALLAGLALTAGTIRRELRIRRRLAAIQPMTRTEVGP